MNSFANTRNEATPAPNLNIHSIASI